MKPERISCNYSFLSTNGLAAGSKNYSDLKERFLILLCDYDPGLERKPYDTNHHTLGKLDLKAGVHIIGLNASLLKEDCSELGQQTSDFYQYEPAKIHDPLLKNC